MSKPNYRVVLAYDGERKVFLARAPELEHCTAEGATRAEAIAAIEQEIDAQLANMLSHGTTPPRSVDEETFSGEIAAKVSKTLHRDLHYQARTDGVDLEHLVGELLGQALEARKQNRGGVRSGNRAHADHDGNRAFDGNRRGRGNNVHLLDDRASFIEYVRGLENQGNQAGHNRGPNQGHGGRRGGRGRGRGGNGFRGDNRQGYGGNGRQDGHGHGGGQAHAAHPPAPAGGMSAPPSGGDGDGEI